VKVSVSIELVWNLAAQEAVASAHGNIEPEHLCEALLKFAELPVEEICKVAGDPALSRQIGEEVESVREALSQRQVDSTAARRALRSRLGMGSRPYRGGVVHRSQASKDIFEAAARFAHERGADFVCASHLLEALLARPTQVMAEVLADAISPTGPRRPRTPLLDKLGRDLTRLAAEGNLPPNPERKAEATALTQILASADKRAVLLVTESDPAARAVLCALAHVLVSGKSARAWRLVDLTEASTDDHDTLNKLLAEAANAQQVILVLPPIAGGRPDHEPAPQWPEQVRRIMAARGPQCICRIAPGMLDQLIAADRSWKRVAHLVSVRPAVPPDLPKEL